MDHRQELDDLRRMIDELDSKIVRLLNERAAIALEIGMSKLRHGTPVHAPARELQVLENVTRGNDGPVSNESLHRIYLELMQECRRLEHDMIQRTGDNDTAAER